MLGLEQRHDRHGGRPTVRRAAQRARVFHGIDAVLAVFVIHKRHAVSEGRPRKDRRQRRDALHAGEHVGQLVNLATAQVVQKNVGDARPIGYEGEGTAVGRPHRIDVLPDLHVAQQLRHAGVEMEQRDPQIAEAQQIEIGFAAAVGHERDRLPVG